jgi:chromosome segregation ATPase
LSTFSADIERNRRNIDEIKARWLEKLEALVDNISERFSAYFEHMDYAGEIRLNKGNNNEDDFTNYGLEVMVKFRDKYDLQRLDPFKQSGGERSVSTALYMMAMQHMTQVPFRCVDEINQGMDEKNERKVFDLLIETAVKSESPSQYFLLTPKLLNDLHFVRGVDIHHVHNGIDMSHGPNTLMKNFREVAANRKRNSEI